MTPNEQMYKKGKRTGRRSNRPGLQEDEDEMEQRRPPATGGGSLQQQQPIPGEDKTFKAKVGGRERKSKKCQSPTLFGGSMLQSKLC